MNIWNWLLEMLYPNTCCFCGKVSRQAICKVCAKKIEYVEEPRCKKCGKPVRYEEQEYCFDCQKKEFHYEQGKNIWLHKFPVNWSIYQFKYQNRRIYGKFYAQELYRLYGTFFKEWRIDAIIPIPLHKRRKRIRGYNQADILAKHLGKLAGIPVKDKVMMRVKYTKPQKQLNDKERRRNLQQAFRVVKHWKPVEHVLLVDDIYTTGSTIDAVAEVLKNAGVQKVFFFTISIGQGF